jgi:hypothetical protein
MEVITMDANQFKARMGELAVMVRNDQAMDLFTESYEALLNEVKQEMDADRRTEQAAKMKMMLMVQSGYVLNEYIHRGRAATPPHMIRGCDA